MSRTDTAVRVISASPDRVFAALTASDARAVWLGIPSGTKVFPQLLRRGRRRKPFGFRAVSGRGLLLGDELDEVAAGVIEDRDDCGADVGGRLGE